MQITSVRSFEQVDQIKFAELSGDWNPIHIDPVAARRTHFGQIVHGIHIVAWVLEEFITQTELVPGKVKVAFLSPINLSEVVHVVLIQEGTDMVILVQRDTRTYATIRIQSIYQLEVAPCATPPIMYSRVPSDHYFAELNSKKGTLEAWGNPSHLKQSFPSLVRAIGACRTASLFSLSRLVGMICPGLHSIFSGFDISFIKSETFTITYQVIRHSIPNAPIRIAFTGSGVVGSLDAFVRPSPVKQLGMDVICQLVHPEEFADQIALVVGGSRGLGEVISKVVAAGGGLPIITYKVGEQDALRLQDEILATGGKCDVLNMDVLDTNSIVQKIADLSGKSPTHLYYFASPLIKPNFSPPLDKSLMELYKAYYVSAFEALCTQLSQGGVCKILYPSSVYVDAAPPGFLEYVKAKMLGEELCLDLARKYPNLIFLSERLPKMHTDQTNHLLEKQGEQPLKILLSMARKLSGVAQN